MKKDRGFSLSELMVVVAIVAILLAIGVPSYRYITNSYRMSAEVNGLLGDLMYARGEAIKEGQDVTLCVSKDNLTCDAGSNTWQEGWIVFQDPNDNATVDAGENVLRVQRIFKGSDTMGAGPALSSVTFNREGFATGSAGAAFAGTTYTLHDSTASTTWTRCLIISNVGEMVTSSAADQTNGACGP